MGIRQAFLDYSKRGEVMTKEELAAVLKVKPDYVRRHSKPPHGFIPRIPRLRNLRFDPMKMIEVFCQPISAEKPRSLKSENRNSGGNPKGGFRKCL